jgi:hypothetical protein
MGFVRARQRPILFGRGDKPGMTNCSENDASLPKICHL